MASIEVANRPEMFKLFNIDPDNDGSKIAMMEKALIDYATHRKMLFAERISRIKLFDAVT